MTRVIVIGESRLFFPEIGSKAERINEYIPSKARLLAEILTAEESAIMLAHDGLESEGAVVSV